MEYKRYSVLLDYEGADFARFDYAHTLERLRFHHSRPKHRGHWFFCGIAANTKPASRLKAYAEEQWISLETFTRKIRPQKNGSQGWEIWARIAPTENES